MTWFKIDSITFVKAHTETGAICIFRLDHVRLAKPTSGSSGTTLYFGANMWVNIQEPFNEYEALSKHIDDRFVLRADHETP